ncbi:MAG: DUF4080 domain-containing protein [Clostridiales bacterium]
MATISLVSLNSKYIHSSLAPWYLKSQSEFSNDINVIEYTINDKLDNIIEDLYFKNSKYLFFSCYIWNIDLIIKISKDIKKINKNIVIVLGGPEVSYDIERIFRENNHIDFIIKGEGEVPFVKFVKNIFKSEKSKEKISGLYSRYSSEFEEYSDIYENLDEIISPYTNEMLNSCNNKIIYFESSRGCPFRCSYCLSSLQNSKVRFFSLKRVKEDIIRILDSNVNQIKFVDRTFNCNKKRFFDILEFVNELERDINFHFEISANLIDDEVIEFLKFIKPGRIQFEIGIQSTNKDVLNAVDRNSLVENLLSNIEKLINLKNIHIHVDLITGLPYEDLKSFKNSFNDVYKLNANKIQLGFLKLLKGTKIRKEYKQYGYRFKDYPPYEILFNDFISYKEITELKNIEVLIDKYYNSKKFIYILEFIKENNLFKSPYELYKYLSKYYMDMGYKNIQMSLNQRYKIFFEFLKKYLSKVNCKILSDILKFDFLTSDNTKNIPSYFDRVYLKELRSIGIKSLKNDLNYLKISENDIKKGFHFELFEYEIVDDFGDFIFDISNIIKGRNAIVFDYTKKSNINNYKFDKLKLSYESMEKIKNGK